MAQLNSRGTMTRSRWDYFESSDGFAFIYGSVPTGGIGAYFANNSTGATALDIYNLTWSASVPGVWEVIYFVPPLVLTPLVQLDAQVQCIAPDHAVPPGIVGMFTANAGLFRRIVHYSNQPSNGSVNPLGTMNFLTLPPGWAIAVAGNAGANPVELSMSVWYQEVVDNVSPAR